MRKYQKTQCFETLKLLAEAHAEIAKYIERKQTGQALSLLEQCQQGAIGIGTMIDATEGEGTETSLPAIDMAALEQSLHPPAVSAQIYRILHGQHRHHAVMSAKSCIAWLKERGEDVFFECTGRNEVLNWGLDSVKPDGKVVLVGNPDSDMVLKRDTYWKILRNQLHVIGTWNSSFTGEAADDWHYVMERLKMQRIAPKRLITHRLPLAGLRDGLEVMKEKKEDYCKIMVFPED